MSSPTPNACGGSTEVLPTGWEGAEELPLAGAECSAPVGSPPSVEVASRADTLEVFLHRFGKRCDQDLCGFSREHGAATKVLIQPCEMHPESVTNCSCPTEVALVLGARTDRGTIQIWSRNDSYGLTGPNEPRLLDTQAVPVPQ